MAFTLEYQSIFFPSQLFQAPEWLKDTIFPRGHLSNEFQSYFLLLPHVSFSSKKLQKKWVLGWQQT